MRSKLLFIISSFMIAGALSAQTPVDTVFEPKVVYSGLPHTYEIAGITVTGADNYEDYLIIGYSGLKVGERVEIPGDEITQASKRLWHQGLFSSVQIKVEKLAGDKAWLNINLRPQPRIAAVNYHGMKKANAMTFRKSYSCMLATRLHRIR